MLTSDLDRLALASKAVAGPLSSTPQLPGNETTLRRLGQPGVNATALSPQVGIGLDQTRMGRSAHGVRIHLRGSYTPLPQSVGGQLVATVAGDTIDRWPADSTGTIDRWVDVPDDVLARYTTLALRLDISGDTGRCGEFQPLTLTIDGDSPVLSSPAQPPVPAGFQSVPQSLMPRTAVGIGGGFDDTRRAVAIMVGLQRLSSLPIDTAVMPLKDAVADASPAILISATGWSEERITLPVAADADGELTVERADAPGETTTLTLDPALGFGSLQVARDGQRTVLVATSREAPDQLDALLDWLGQNPRRWSNLDGTALIAAPGRQPVVFNTDAAVEPQPQAVTSAGRPWWIWAAVAAVAAVVAAGDRADHAASQANPRTVMTVVAPADSAEEPAPTVLQRYYAVHPTYRLIVRWGLIAVLTGFAFYRSIVNLIEISRNDTLAGYVWTVPTAAVLVAVAIARRKRTELPIHDRQTDIIVGILGFGLALLIQGVLLPRYALYFDLLRLDLVAMWLFVASSAVVLFGLRPVIRFAWVWGMLSLVFALPYYIAVIALGGGKTAAGAGDAADRRAGCRDRRRDVVHTRLFRFAGGVGGRLRGARRGHRIPPGRSDAGVPAAACADLNRRGRPGHVPAGTARPGQAGARPQGGTPCRQTGVGWGAARRHRGSGTVDVPAAVNTQHHHLRPPE